MVTPGAAAAIAVIGVEVVVVGLLVTYLLYRRKEKDALKPKGPISTTYDESEGGKRNGDVTLTITGDDEKKPLPSTSASGSSSRPSTPDSDKKLLSPEDTTINIEDDEETPESGEEVPLTGVVVDENIDPTHHDDGLQKEPPGTPPPPFEDKEDDDSSLDVPPMKIIVPQTGRDEVVPQQPGDEQLLQREKKSSESSLSSEDERVPVEEEIDVKRYPDMEEEGRKDDTEEPVRKRTKSHRRKFVDMMGSLLKSSDEDFSEAEEDLITKTDYTPHEESVSQRQHVEEGLIAPASEAPREELVNVMHQGITSSEDEEPVVKVPRRRRRKVVEEPLTVVGTAQTDELKRRPTSSSSSELEPDMLFKKSYGVISTQTDEVPKRRRSRRKKKKTQATAPPTRTLSPAATQTLEPHSTTTTSSETSSQSEAEYETREVGSISTQTPGVYQRGAERSSRRKKKVPMSPKMHMRSRTLSPASTQTMAYLPPRRAFSPMGTQTNDMRISGSGSSVSESENRRRRWGLQYKQKTVEELVQHYESPQSLSASSSINRGQIPRRTSSTSTQSSITGRGTQTRHHRHRKVVVTMAEMQTQTREYHHTPSSSEVSSSSEEELEIVYVYEKGIQIDMDEEREEKGTEIGIQTKSPQTGTQTAPKRQRRVKIDAPVQPTITSRKISLTRRRSIPVLTSSAGTGTDPEHFKSEAHVQFMASPTTVVFAAPTHARKKIVFKSAWQREVKLEDLVDAGIVDFSMKDALETGQILPDDAAVVAIVKPYLEGKQPVAGLLLMNSGEKISLYEAVKRGFIRRGHAVSILEAQVASGSVIDPKTGIRMTVNDAAKMGVIDTSYVPVLHRAEKAVVGYQTRGHKEPLSVYQAMSEGAIVHKHGIRLLEAQLATGGIIDPKANHRLPSDIAYRRNLCDQDTMEILQNQDEEHRGFYDPTTKMNITYKELLSKCITDLDTGVILLPFNEGRSQQPLRLDENVTKIESTEVHLSPSSPTVSIGSIGRPMSPSFKSEYYITEAHQDVKSAYLKEVIVEALVQKMHKDEAIEEALEEESRSSTSSSDNEMETHDEEEKKTYRESAEHIHEKMIQVEEPMETAVTEVSLELTPQYAPVEVQVKTKPQEAESDGSGSEYEDEFGVKRRRKRTHKSMTEESTITTTTIETTETTLTKKPRKNIKFTSGWQRSVTLDNLFDAGVISKETVEQLEEGKLQVDDVQASLQQYLVGEEPIGGLLIAETGEKISIYAAWKKGLIRRGTSISLLEAQAATGRIIDPVTADKMSVNEASKCGLIDRQFEAVLVRAERAVYGYKTRLSSETFSLFEAMKKGLVVENHGVRLLEAQIATGGIIDPRANHRLPVEAAFKRQLFDERLNQILEDPSDDTRGFFDPNTQENLTYLELMERCVIDKDTGLRLLPLTTEKKQQTAKHSKVIFESSQHRPVMIHHVLDAEAIDKTTAERFEKGEMTTEEVKAMVGKLRVFVDGSAPIAGIINSHTNEKMTILEASKCGFIRKGTAFELLEAQACCGKLMDVQSGRSVSIETALSTGIIDKEFEDIVTRAHRAVTGYRGTYKSEIFSLCDAINRHLIVRKHGIRLLEAQIATGGIIDLKSPVRISVEVAQKRHLVDTRLARELTERKTKSYFDPVTGENLNYAEMLARCVVDKDTGLLFMMIEGGTVTSYLEPFESDPQHKIRSRSFSPVRTKTEVVETKQARSLSRTQHTTTIEEHDEIVVTKTKKKSSHHSRQSSASSTTSSTAAARAIRSRQVVIVDPTTDEELNIHEARKRRLIDKATYRKLKEQEGDFDEETRQRIEE